VIRVELLERVSELRAARKAFVVATVVRVAKPASAHAGDSAILLPDGTLEGFVGGMCSESTVRTQGLRQLATGRSILLHITPPPQASVARVPGDLARAPGDLARAPGDLSATPSTGSIGVDGAADSFWAGAGEDSHVRKPVAEEPDAENEVTVGNPCLSGGALDIFLEVMRPAALVHVYGDTPVARALAAVGGAAGADMRATTDPGVAIPQDASAVVVASQGGDEHRVIDAALKAGVPYVGLLASRRRGAAVIAALGLDAEQRARLHTPAGLDIGAQSPGEVALSIMAEIIAETRSSGPFHMTGLKTGGMPAASRGPVEAIDPICGMTVAVTESAIGVETQDGRVYFCCPGCRDAFLADPGRYTHTL
jgi:xanthine dehydrogenase accessory factor